MKTVISLIFLLLISSGISAQILNEVEVQPPEFLGVTNENYSSGLEIEDYIAERMQYPSVDMKFKNEGTEVILFTVGTDGKLSDFEVVNSISREVDDEVIRVLRTTDGMWIAGTNNDGPVAMQKEIAIAFKISADGNNENLTDFKAVAEKYFKKGTRQLYVKEHPRRALRQINQGIVYMPFDDGLMVLRGYCKYTLGDVDGASEDLNLVREISGMDNLMVLAQEYDGADGFVDLIKQIDIVR